MTPLKKFILFGSFTLFIFHLANLIFYKQYTFSTISGCVSMLLVSSSVYFSKDKK